MGTTALVPHLKLSQFNSHKVQTPIDHLWVSDLRMSCRNWTSWQGTKLGTPAMAVRSHALLYGKHPNMSCKQYLYLLWLLYLEPPVLSFAVTTNQSTNITVLMKILIQCKPDISRLVGSMERYRDISGSAIYRATAMSQNPGQVFQRVVSGDGAFVCLAANSARRQRISKFSVVWWVINAS